MSVVFFATIKFLFTGDNSAWLPCMEKVSDHSSSEFKPIYLVSDTNLCLKYPQYYCCV